MAIFQVVDQDGQKALVEVPTGNDDIWGRYVPGVVPDNPAVLIADLPVGAYVTDDKQLPARSVPAPYNTEEWITESGTWAAPVTGWYDVLIINGGQGSYLRTTSDNEALSSGMSGRVESVLMYFEQGREITVSIGAGGLSVIEAQVGPKGCGELGGNTYFDGYTPQQDTMLSGHFAANQGGGTRFEASLAGGGIGGGGMALVQASIIWDGIFWGAGGGIYYYSGSMVVQKLGNGKQGAVRVRWYDPNKENN